WRWRSVTGAPSMADHELADATGGGPDPADLLPRAGILLGLAPTDRDDAVRRAGQLLIDLGAVDPDYAATMIQREAMVSSYVGEGFALPHGTDEGRAMVRRATMAFLQFPDGIDWDGQTAHVAIPIAAAEGEHMAVMSRLAQILLDPDAAERLRTTDDPDEVLALLAPQPAVQD
ncbi:MAG TPA: PTS sugar transporter subunit IIA, partial [Euzebya sp.]|nr:PTS sugar transporter subunit IIA [Euzebya sp.]